MDLKEASQQLPLIHYIYQVLDWHGWKTTENFGYRNLNMLSSMTLSLENLDSTVNKKHGTQTVLTYAQSFASTTKESVKESA